MERINSTTTQTKEFSLKVKPAQRLKTIEEYYFSKKLREVERLRSNGVKILNLGIGSPDLSPPEQSVATLIQSASTSDNHGYQAYKGTPELRISFGKWYNEFYNVNLDSSSEILPLLGSKEGIFHISMAFVNPGDEVLVPDPGYPAYGSTTRLVGGNVRTYDLDSTNNWEPVLEKLEETSLSRVKLMWVNYPNMPTGAKASKNLFEKLISFARKHDILMVNDNPYSFILNNHPVSILSVAGAKEVALELNSLSKSHNMAGWRVGMVAGKQEYLNYILKVKSNIDSGMFKPVQMAASKALREGKEWYTAINSIYKKRQKLAEQLLSSLGCTFSLAQSGLFVWAKIPSAYENEEVLTDILLYEHGIFVTPGFIFGKNGRNHIRISLCSDEKIIKEAIHRIIM